MVPRGRERRVSAFVSPAPASRWSGYLERVERTCGGGLRAYFESGPDGDTVWIPLAISGATESRISELCSD